MRANLVGYGFTVGLDSLTNFVFDPSRPYVGCRVCGRVFQSEADRTPVVVFEKQPADFGFQLDNVDKFALGLRKEWSKTHAKKHTEAEHAALASSGRWATPEAAQRLASLGIFSLFDLVLDNEVSNALAESKAVPVDDVEGT